MTGTTPHEEVSAIVRLLDDDQRAFLLRYEATLEDQPVASAEQVWQCAFYVQVTPDEVDPEDGFLLWPGEKVFFASGVACSPEGSATFDECSIRYNETGLLLRSHLMEAPNAD